MEDLKQTVARNIAALRRESGMTQIELAQALSYSDKAVSKWERGESIPDVSVLKEIASLFSVSVDYLLEAEHDQPAAEMSRREKHNRAFITGMCILLVWMIATLFFILPLSSFPWMPFVYAVPASMILWLVFNSVWFNPRKNFLIVSLLMWTVLGAVYLSLLVFGGVNFWLIFTLGIPGQAIILLWSRIKAR